jgi:hypothetical protein
MSAFVPRCVQRTGKECRDCVECLSKIPDGKVCLACQHAMRCTALGYTTNLLNHICGFAPSRFLAKVPA